MGTAFFRPLWGPGSCALGHFFCALHVSNGFPCGLVLGIPRGMGVQFLSLLLFALAFLSGVGCDLGTGAVWGGVSSGACCRSSNLEGRSIIEHSSIRV